MLRWRGLEGEAGQFRTKFSFQLAAAFRPCGFRWNEIMADIEGGMFGDKDYFKPMVDSVNNMKVRRRAWHAFFRLRRVWRGWQV